MSLPLSQKFQNPRSSFEAVWWISSPSSVLKVSSFHWEVISGFSNGDFVVKLQFPYKSILLRKTGGSRECQHAEGWYWQCQGWRLWESSGRDWELDTKGIQGGQTLVTGNSNGGANGGDTGRIQLGDGNVGFDTCICWFICSFCSLCFVVNFLLTWWYYILYFVELVGDELNVLLAQDCADKIQVHRIRSTWYQPPRHS